jgi:tRNA U38,U39,U40 pseudouridine synthase TruA
MVDSDICMMIAKCCAGLKCDGSEDDAQKLAVFRRALGLFVGYHPFHNYTRRQ